MRIVKVMLALVMVVVAALVVIPLADVSRRPSPPVSEPE